MDEPTKPLKTIKAQPKQEAFLSSWADIVFYGGHAGGGKTFALLMEPLRHIYNRRFIATFIRRYYPDFTQPGGIIDESMELYPGVGLTFKQQPMTWHGPGFGKISLRNIPDNYNEYRDALAGMQTALLCLDQAEQLTADQFFFLLTRLRSTSGVQPYVRATCNPDPDSFLASFLSWYIDPATGLPIPERCGVVRYFVKVDDDVCWGHSPDYALSRARARGHNPKPVDVKSVTFIEAKLEDNQELMTKDPSYEANLRLQDRVTRERLIGGNWKIRPAAGLVYKREWYELVRAIPAGGRGVRFWDLAGTAGGGDWTVGLKRIETPGPKYWDVGMVRRQVSAAGIDDLLLNTATQDGPGVTIGLFQDPAQAGKYQVDRLVKLLAGYDVKIIPATRDVYTLCRPSSAQAEHGNTKILVNPDGSVPPWVEQYLVEHENYDGSDKARNDIIAADAGSLAVLTKTGNWKQGAY
jgi:phage terminase large subunit-like protein